MQTVVNLPARSKGIEADFSTRPVRGLTLQLSGSLLDTEVKNVELPDLATIVNHRLPQTPGFSGNALIRYDLPLDDRFKTSFQLDTTFFSSHFLEPNNRAVLKQSGYAIINGRIALTGRDDSRWELAVWVKNLADKRYKTAAYDLSSAFGFDLFTYGMPRTAGGELTYRF